MALSGRLDSDTRKTRGERAAAHDRVSLARRAPSRLLFRISFRAIERRRNTGREPWTRKRLQVTGMRDSGSGWIE
jgi:hypothetical protein